MTTGRQGSAEPSGGAAWQRWSRTWTPPGKLTSMHSKTTRTRDAEYVALINGLGGQICLAATRRSGATTPRRSAPTLFASASAWFHVCISRRTAD
jgi:hypothetical protein